MLVDSRVIRNYILLLAASRLGIPYRKKERPYPLVTILGDLILYRDGIIRIETGLVRVELEG